MADPKQPNILDSIVAGSYDPLAVPGPLAAATTSMPGPEAPGWADAHSVPAPLASAVKGPTLGTQDQLTAPAESAERGPTGGGSLSPDGKTLTLPAQTRENSSEPLSPEEHVGILKTIGRLAAGATGLESPKSSPQANLGAKIGGLIGRAGAGLALAAGTPEQKQLAEEQLQTPLKIAQIQNEREWRRGMLGINQQNADTKGKTEQDKYALGDAAMGLPPGTSRMTAMAAAENAASNEKLRAAQVEKIKDSLSGQIRPGEALSQLLGIPNEPLDPIHYQQQVTNPLKNMQLAIQDLPDGEYVVSRTSGKKLYRLGDSSSLARAQAYQTGKPVVDLNPNTGAQQFDTAGNAMAGHLTPGSAGHQMVQVWGPALDSGERLQVMEANLQSALKGDQQAMLSLLANHLGMTMGLQKGARLNQAIISEAEQSRPWLEGMKAKFDDRGYLKGVVLSPQQMQQMVELGRQRYQTDVQKARYESSLSGLGEEPQLPIDPDTLRSNPAPQALPKRGNGSTPSTSNSNTPPKRPAGVPVNAVWNTGTKTWQIPKNQ